MSLVSLTRFLLFLFMFILLFSGCAPQEKLTFEEKAAKPEVTAAYLLEHRIITYEPRFRERVVSTLPFEVISFEDSFLFYLVARIPDQSIADKSTPQYYLWLERRARNWKDYVKVYSKQLSNLTIKSHYSSIRQGEFYKDYTIDLTLEQLHYIHSKGLDLTLINKNNQGSYIRLPKTYIDAFMQILDQEHNSSTTH